MKIVRQLSVFLANKPGTLASLCKVLAQSGINIIAMTIVDSVDHAVVRMVVSDHRAAVHLFGERGTLALESEVVLMEVENKPGGLTKIASKLAKAKINIEYAYCTVTEGQAAGHLVLKTANPAQTVKVLSAKPKRRGA